MGKVNFRGVVEIPEDRLTQQEREFLTAIAEQGESVPGKPKTFSAYVMTDRGTVLVPRYLYIDKMKKKEDEIEINERPLDAQGFEFHGQFYDEQIPGITKLVEVLKKEHGVMGKGRCGTGKTVIGSYLLSRVRSKKSAVMVDQFNLAEQWALQIQTHLPDAKVSFIMPTDKQAKIYAKMGKVPEKPMMKEDLRGDVIICMAQTLMRRDTAKLPIDVTLLIVDEAHKFSAPRFNQSIFHFSFRYSVALTATDERRDGLSWVFKQTLGPTVVQLSGRRMNPTVLTIDVNTTDRIMMRDHKLVWCSQHRKAMTPYQCRLYCPTGDYVPGNNCGSAKETDKMNFTDMNLRLTLDEEYNLKITQLVYAAWKAGRHTIVFGKYKKHLIFLRKEAIECGVPEEDTALYFGGMDKDTSLKPQMTFATYGVAKYGLDVPWKDCEILALPVTEVEQVAGRVERVMEGKRTPIVIDVTPAGVPFYANQKKARLKFYREARYDIVTCNSIVQTREALDSDMED